MSIKLDLAAQTDKLAIARVTLLNISKGFGGDPKEAAQKALAAMRAYDDEVSGYAAKTSSEPTP